MNTINFQIPKDTFINFLSGLLLIILMLLSWNILDKLTFELYIKSFYQSYSSLSFILAVIIALIFGYYIQGVFLIFFKNHWPFEDELGNLSKEEKKYLI